MKREAAYQVALKFVDTFYPNCDVALLAGSVTRNQATSTSDLDIVIVDAKLPHSFRESTMAFGWPIEVFVHTNTSYHNFFAMDVARAQPTLPRLVADGIAIRDNGSLDKIKQEAIAILEQGPAPWSAETVKVKRYALTDLADDFIGAELREEQLCIVLSLASSLQEFYLRMNQHWVGESKWMYRELQQYDANFAKSYIEALEAFYQQGNKQSLLTLVNQVLAPYGGRLFEGFSLGKD